MKSSFWLSSESNFIIYWSCIATLCYWLNNYVPLFHHGLHVFASNSDWFIRLFTTVVIGQSNYFGFTQVQTALKACIDIL